MSISLQKSTNSQKYHLKIKDWPIHERPREKLLKHGAAYLSDAELLAILIGSGAGGVTALDVAKCMLLNHGQLFGLSRCNHSELARIRGIGKARAARLIASFEVGRRIEQYHPDPFVKIGSPNDVIKLFQPSLRPMKQEVFKVVLLDSGNRIIRDVDITLGTLDASLVHPREVFKTAVDYSAAGVILLHNHPSGIAQPSSQDRKITKQLVDAGKIMGIPVLDHIIIACDGFFSFANEGFI